MDIVIVRWVHVTSEPAPRYEISLRRILWSTLLKTFKRSNSVKVEIYLASMASPCSSLSSVAKKTPGDTQFKRPNMKFLTTNLGTIIIGIQMMRSN